MNFGRLWSDTRGRPVMWQSTAMIAVCFVDMYSTLVVVQLGLAVETNPLLAGFLKIGAVPFLTVKGLSFLIPVGVIEIIRPCSPRLIPKMLGTGVAAYILSYIVGTIVIHGWV